jgi:CubicO group peptidase (beta-lactamase class C family)
MAEPWVEAFDAYARDLLGRYKVPGFSIAVAENGTTLYEHGYGFRDVAQDLPATPDTVYGIGSCTKSFTCVAILQLQERGKLSVHDPVVRYLPEFRTPDADVTRRITIHHLMTHTAGLPPLPSLQAALAPAMREDPSVPAPAREAAARVTESPRTAEELMAFIAKTEFTLLGEPGQFFSYSNDGYALLGAVIERVSGQRYADYLRDHILHPAGMLHSAVDLASLPADAEVTTLYAQRERDGIEAVFAAPSWWEAPAMEAAGFLRCSVRDLLRYTEIYRTGGRVGEARLLSSESVQAMMRPYAACGPRTSYGYGLMITPDYHGVSVVEHGGSIKGVAAEFAVIPEMGLTGAALTNLAGVPTAQILLGALNARMGLPVDTPLVALPDHVCPPARLHDYAGRYVSGEGATTEVKVEDQRLWFVIDGRALPARPAGPDVFAVRIRAVESPATFLRDASGRVCAVHLGFRHVRRAEATPAA